MLPKPSIKKLYEIIDEKILPAWNNSFLFLILFVANFGFYTSNHNVYSAYSFLHGSLALTKWSANHIDLAVFNNQVYWPHGPFPAIILAPFTLIFGLSFQENFLKFFMSILNFFIAFRLGILMKLPKTKAYWLALFFVFGSLYTPVAILPFSSYFMNATVATLLLLSIYFFLNSKNFFLAGLLLSFAVLTRPTTIFGSLFFIYLILRNKSPRDLVKFTVPIIASVLIFGLYNYARFGNALETGRTYQLLVKELQPKLEVGMFSYKHSLENFYYLILKLPEFRNTFPFLVYNPYGMSIFILSPVLLLIFKAKLNDKINRACLLAIFVTLIPIIFYYGNGYTQIGYRYALDFFPFLFLILLSSVKKVSLQTVKILVLIGIFLSLFFTIEMLLLGKI